MSDGTAYQDAVTTGVCVCVCVCVLCVCVLCVRVCVHVYMSDKQNWSPTQGAPTVRTYATPRWSHGDRGEVQYSKGGELASPCHEVYV